MRREHSSPQVVQYSRPMRSQEDRDDQTVLIARAVFIAAIAVALPLLVLLALDWLF